MTDSSDRQKQNHHSPYTGEANASPPLSPGFLRGLGEEAGE